MLTGVRMAEDDEIPLLYGQTMLGEPVEITVHEALDDFDIYEMMDAPLWTLPHKTTTSSSGYYYLNGRTTSH